MANINCYKSQNMHFCISSHCFKDINFLNLCPWKFHSMSPSILLQWCYSEANTNVYKSHILILALTVSEISRFKIFCRKYIGNGQVVQHEQWWHSMANISVYKRHTTIFYASSHRFRDINVLNVWPWNFLSEISI